VQEVVCIERHDDNDRAINVHISSVFHTAVYRGVCTVCMLNCHASIVANTSPIICYLYFLATLSE